MANTGSTVPIPTILTIGAGSRGNAYAKALIYPPAAARATAPNVRFAGVAEPDAGKRARFIRDYGLGPGALAVQDWRELVTPDGMERIKKAGINAVIVATLDDTHKEIILALRPLNLHILCEKPLATTLEDCKAIRDAVLVAPEEAKEGKKEIIFGIGHVLRYSPHNLLLRELLCGRKVIGEVISADITEPVGWYHFAHSYVRGNWRSSSTSAPSLLTKSCHDIDIGLWLLAHPNQVNPHPHYPQSISSSGSLSYFHRRTKPKLAGSATNCFSCLAERECKFSAKNIYLEINKGISGWPNKIVAPEIVDLEDWPSQRSLLERTLSKPDNQYGRCVYEHDNDVADNQLVMLNFAATEHHLAKTANIRMVAFSQAICDRKFQFYGTDGELTSDSKTITVTRFGTAAGTTQTFTPEQFEGQGHGGGDYGLAKAFAEAVADVLRGKSVREAQWEWLKTDVEEAWMCHRLVFLAEKARVEERVVSWNEE